MNRQEFRNRYREARNADGFLASLWGRLRGVKGDLSMFTTTRACPGFSAARLHGDSLRYGSSVKIGNRVKWQSTPRLAA